MSTFIDFFKKLFGYDKKPQEIKVYNNPFTDFNLKLSDDTNLVFHRAKIKMPENYIPMQLSKANRQDLYENLTSMAVGSAAYAGAAAQNLSGLYQATVPVQTLMQYGNGTISSIVREGGKFASHNGFVPANVNVFTPMIAFQVASMITGQYYLNGITKQLKAIDKKIDKILEKLESENKGKIMSAYQLIQKLSEQTCYTQDDFTILHLKMNEVHNLYCNYFIQMENICRDNSIYEYGCMRNIGDVRETWQNFQASNFFYISDMAASSYDLYCLGRIVYLKMCMYMSQFDNTYITKSLAVKDELKNYSNNMLPHQVLFFTVHDNMEKYISNKLADAWTASDKIRDHLNNSNYQFDSENKRIFAYQNDIVEMQKQLTSGFEGKQQIVYKIDPEKEEVFVYGHVDNR